MTTKKRMAKGATFSNAIGPRKTTQLAAANSDLDEIIPGFTGDGSAQSARLPQQTSPPPSYESWDVLRQYPRAAPLAPPAQSSVAAPKPQDTSKTVKESKDAQGKTATE
jgi:type IV secretion system protein VirB1